MTDLFYSETNFKLTSSIYFPYNDILGFIIQTTYKFEPPFYLKEISYKKTIKETCIILIFEDSTTNARLSLECPKVENINEDYYTYTIYDINREYSGCLTGTAQFQEWINTLNNIHASALENSLLLNPSYCYYNGHIQDYRLHYHNQPVDLISLSGVKATVQTDKKGKVSCTLSLDREEEELEGAKATYLQQLIIRDNNSAVTLKGDSICLCMQLPGEGEYCNTEITFDGITLKIEDSALKGLL